MMRILFFFILIIDTQTSDTTYCLLFWTHFYCLYSTHADPWQDLKDNYGKGGYERLTQLRQTFPHLKVNNSLTFPRADKIIEME